MVSNLIIAKEVYNIVLVFGQNFIIHVGSLIR